MEVSAEVHFAQKLASNEKKIRDRAVKRLKKYLSVRSNQKSLSDADLIKIWKGLFYCMWMQDKPLIQEELSTRITNLLHSFPSTREALRFVKACLETFAREWHGIDKLRLDKFMMMLRDMLHETFSLLSKDGWQILECRAFASFVTQHVMDPKESRLPDGLKLHLSDIFIDEINKVSLEELNSRKMVVLLQPFIHFIIHSNKIEVVRRIMSDTVHKVCNTMTNEAKLKKQTTQKTTDRKKEEDDMSGDENEEEMDVDQGETETETSLFVFDMAPLFGNLFKMAQEKNVRAPNRAVIYMLLKKYPEVFQNVTSKMKSDCADEEECDLIRNDLRLEKVDGKATDKQLEAANTKKRRKRRQKNKTDLQQVDSKHSSELAVDSEMVEDEDLSRQVKMKKQKKEKNVEYLLSSGSDSSDTAKKKNATEVEDSIKKKRPPKKVRAKKTENDFDIGDNQDKTKSKKRKRLSVDSISPLIAKKKSKLSQSVNDSSADLMEDVIDTTPKIKKQKLKKSKYEQEKNDSVISQVESSPSEWSINSSAEKNTNSNARSKSKSRVMTNLVAPVELVVYPSDASTALASGSSESGFVSGAVTRTSVKSKKKKSAFSPTGQKLDIFSGIAGTGDMSEASTSSAFKKEEDMDIETVSEKSSSLPGRKGTRPRQDEKGSDVLLSMSTSAVYLPDLKKGHSRKASPSVNSEDLGKGKESDGTTSIVKEFCTVMSTPCSMVKKAIAMVTTNSDPGPDADKKIQLAVADESMTPGQKKKVVFNLRKNKANKFKDYLKSLENQPDSPFQPSKSPSFGILKSPAPSPVVSNMDVDGANSGETGRSRKKEALSRRRASAPGGIAVSNDNRLKHQSLSPVKGARSSQFPTGCKPRLKQRAKK